jgi:exonuclease VII large subunit
MELLYFALGFLSMVLFSFIGGAVWGLVKVIKIQRQIDVIKKNDEKEFDYLYQRIDKDAQYSNEHFREFSREYDRKLQQMTEYEIKRFDELLRIIQNNYEDSIRYTDRRVDKSCTKQSNSQPPQPNIPTPPLS